MKRLSIREMRNNLGRLDELVRQEGELLVTRRGKVIARILPERGARRVPTHADLRARMPRLPPSQELIREDREHR